MSFKATAFKGVFFFLILYIFSNPLYSKVEYNKITSWLSGFIFGLCLVFIIVVFLKSRGSDDVTTKLYDN